MSIDLVKKFSLPQTPLLTPVVVNLVDGSSSVVTHSASVSLVVGTFAVGVAATHIGSLLGDRK